jgi:3-hydroxybutyryl-CoA dehydratase
MELFVGKVLVYERAFTEAELREFTRLSGDVGRHHIQRDEAGRLMLQGLLTATLPTKLGGDCNLIAREMLFEFLRPAFVDELLRCEVTVTELIEEPGRWRVRAEGQCTNPEGKTVLRVRFSGVIFK